MKRIILLVTLISISVGAMAQAGKANSAIRFAKEGDLNRAKADLDMAMANRKSANLPITFFAKGQVAQAAFEYENTTMFGDPLAEAYAAYEKAMELDPKGQIRRRILTSRIYDELAECFYIQGGERFEAGDFKGALKSFESQIRIVEGDKYISAMDTGMYFNAGIAAINSEDYNTAIKYFNICAEMKYMGITPYYQIYEVQLAKGDTVAAEATLKSLPSLFPNDKTITLQLIDLYIKSGKFDEAQKYITMAKEADPRNSILYFAAGIMYLNDEKYDEAIAELQQSIDIDPNLYDAQYGIGAAYINKAASMYRAAEEILDVNQYNSAIDKANEVYAKALPYMEKALELSPNDIYTMQNLKELYYRLRMTDKYDAITAKLDAIMGS